MYQAYITKLKNVRPHPNADRMLLADCFGNTVCVGLNAQEGDVVIYFPTDGQLSKAYAELNNLVRIKNEDGTYSGGYLDPDKRNIKAIKLRGEKSDGLTMPLSSLDAFGDTSALKVGDTISVFNGHEICKKYIPRGNPIKTRVGGSANVKAAKKASYPYFIEHIDTPQLRFNMDMFKPGDIICLTEKIHGTSSRNANTVKVSYKKNILDKIFHRKGKEVSNYDYIVGTRRTIIEEDNSKDGGFYGTHEFRMKWGEYFKNKLHDGEEVFGEIAGFYAPNAPIMGRCDNNKVNDKSFVKKYGATTTFTYGCNEEKGENKYWIYRMTCTTPNGYVIEYPWDLVKRRATEMGLDTAPELDRFIYTTEEDFLNRIEKWTDISSTIDPTHIIEGVVVRKLNSPKFEVAKEKSYSFKIIEGIIKDLADTPDMEEAEELKE